MSDTPETDAQTWAGHCGDGDWGKVVYAHWAQKLERERDAAIDALKKWDAVCVDAEKCNAEMDSVGYSQTRWERLAKEHGDLMESANHARITVLSILQENTKSAGTGASENTL